MARLPVVHSDVGTWGTVLNDYLTSAAGGYATVADRIAGPWRNVIDYGAVGDGVADDTAAIQSAITGAPGGTRFLFPVGTYLIGQLNIDGRFSFVGVDSRGGSVLKAKAGATGPLFNANNASLRPGFTMRHLKFDMSLAPGIQAVYIHNVRNGTIEDIYIDQGTIGLQLDLAQSMNVKDVDVFNCSVSAFLCSHASSSGCNYLNCFTDNTTVSGVAGFDVTGGLDWWFIGCRSFRAPGSSITLRYGWRADYIAGSGLNTNATLALVRCSCDGISDLTSDSANVAGVYLRGIGNSIVSNSHISGFDAAGATHNKAMRIDQCNSLRIQDNWISGHGITFQGTVSDGIVVTNNQFSSGDANGARFGMTTPPTRLDARGNTLGSGSFNIPITDNAAAYYGALVRHAQVAAGLNVNRPTTPIFENLDVTRLNLATTALTSGTLYLFGIWLPQGFTVTNISWMSGGTALVNGASPHYWVALYTSAKALMAQSTDDTAPVIAANAEKTTALSTPQTTTTEGKFYVGIMVNSGAGTQPTFSNFAALSAVANLGQVRAATADTGLTTTAPATAGTTANIANVAYVGVS